MPGVAAIAGWWPQAYDHVRSDSFSIRSSTRRTGRSAAIEILRSSWSGRRVADRITRWSADTSMTSAGADETSPWTGCGRPSTVHSAPAFGNITCQPPR